MKVHADDSPKSKPTKPLKVYWKMCGEGTVHSSYVSHRSKGILFFTDGQHNPSDSCYLTPWQAAAHHCDCTGCRASRLREPGGIKAEIALCNYCGSLNVLMGGYGQCIKGCPGNFQIKAEVRVPREGVKAALKGE